MQRQEVIRLRIEGDRLWRQSMSQVERLLQQLTNRENLLRLRDLAVTAHRSLEQGRALADQAIAGSAQGAINGREWLERSSGFIRASARLRRALATAMQIPPGEIRTYLNLGESIWEASERAGYERGTLGFYISSGRAMPESGRLDLERNRAIIEQSIRRILPYRNWSGLDPRLQEAIRQMEQRTVARFESLRQQVFGESRTGDYSIDAVRWFALASDAIEGLLDINRVATDRVENISRQKQAIATADLALAVVLFLLALVVAVGALVAVRRTTDELHQQKRLAEITLRSIGDGVVTSDARGRVSYLNPVAEELTGYSVSEAQGRPLDEIFPLINKGTRQPVMHPIHVCLEERRVVAMANGTLLRHRDGGEREIEDSAAPIIDRRGEVVGAVMVFYDTSSPRQEQQLLSHHASHDALTQLINRREFRRRLDEVIVRARNNNEKHALCFIDLDQFKVVNDTCGHSAGDRMLAQLAFLLQSPLRSTDTLARLGGDEFGLLLEGCDLDQAQKLLQKLQRVIENFRFAWQGRSFEIHASMGLVPISAVSADAEEVMREADTACFAAKEKGRNRIQIYQPGDEELASRYGEMNWVNRIRSALQGDEFHLHAQRIEPLNASNSLHFEFLLRLQDEFGRVIPPGSFLPAAERFNLMPRVDRWVIAEAFAQTVRLLDSLGQQPLVCNVNLSGASLGDPELLSYVRQQFRESGVPHQCICFEITETAAIANFEAAIHLIRSLRAEGCRFALDDFGSGLSSFSYLKNLPVDYLKIDGSLVKGIVEDSVNRALVETIHRIGHIMGLRTIAEYVADEAILEQVRAIGIDYAQGFAIARPRPVTELLPEMGGTVRSKDAGV